MTPTLRKTYPIWLAGILALAACRSLPSTKFGVTVRVVDDETGAPIPDAWVFATAHVITEPPVSRYEAVAANRGKTGPDGTVRFTRVEGMYRPGEPKDWLWKLVDEKQAKIRRPKYIEGGSLVVAAPKYGLIHQPFAIEDSPAFQQWAAKNKREDYLGWIGPHFVKVHLKPIFVKSEELLKSAEITLRMRKPARVDELVESFKNSAAIPATWSATSLHTGAGGKEQEVIYAFFAKQMKEVAEATQDAEHRAMLGTYFDDDVLKWYIAHNKRPEDDDGDIQIWLAQKALEILPPESEEVKQYSTAILKGVREEGAHSRRQNHFFDPKDPARALPGFESAPNWAGLEINNPGNEYDWQDAQWYYQEGDRAKAYEALGHVLRLLVNLSIPKYTQMAPIKESEFESAVLAAMRNNGNQLPPEYWWEVREPKTAQTPRQRFDELAGVSAPLAADSLEVRLPATVATNGNMNAPRDLTARKTFLTAIGHAAGLMRDFHRAMHLPKVAQLPGNGNGNGTDASHQQLQASTGPAKGQAAEKSKSDTVALERTRIKVVKERQVDRKLVEKFGAERARRLGGERVVAIEFRDPGGKVKRRLDLSIPTKAGEELVIHVKKSKDEKYVLVNKKLYDPSEKNPFHRRKSGRTEIAWYDGDGNKLGGAQFGMTAAAGVMSPDGSRCVVLDSGFDPEELAHLRDVPGLTSTEELKSSPELMDHFLHVLDHGGKKVFTRRFIGPSEPPSHVAFSPSGRWLVVTHGSMKTVVINLASGVEDEFDGPSLNWEIGDDGAISGWKLEKDTGGYEMRDGRFVGVAGKRTFRMFRRALGQSKMRPTHEVMEK